MKIIRFTLILSAFLIMVSATLNLLNSAEMTQAQVQELAKFQPDRTPIYLDLVVMFLLMTCIVWLNGVEKRMAKLKEKNNTPPKTELFSEGNTSEEEK